jgi:hypothetical protein
VDRGLTVGGGVEVISLRGEEGSGDCLEVNVILLDNAFPDDNAFVDSGLARGILDDSGCELPESKGCVSVMASRGAVKSGTGG